MVITMGTIEVIARKFSLTPNYFSVFSVPYLFVFGMVWLLLGIPLFILANGILRRVEKVRNYTLIDHFRQSTFYYLISILICVAWLVNGITGSENDVYFVTLLSISVLSIGVNMYATHNQSSVS